MSYYRDRIVSADTYTQTLLALREARSRVDRAIELLEAAPWSPEGTTVPPEQLGLKVRRWRKSQKLTLRQVSARTRISIAYLSDLETGKLANPSMKTIEALAGVMGLSASELLR